MAATKSAMGTACIFLSLFTVADGIVCSDSRRFVAANPWKDDTEHSSSSRVQGENEENHQKPLTLPLELSSGTMIVRMSMMRKMGEESKLDDESPKSEYAWSDLVLRVEYCQCAEASGDE